MKTFALIIALLSISLFGFGQGNSPVPIKNGKLQSDLNANTNSITNLKDPTNDQDAATKAYVDTHGGGGGSATNAYHLQVSGALLSLSTNAVSFVYTIAGVAQTNANMQLWGTVTPAAYSNSVLSTATNAIAASTNSLDLATGVAARAPTNQFDWNGAATSKALPAMNVLSNGAAGGSTDDTAALQAILNHGGNINFPATNYTTQPLWLTNNTRIFGSGARLVLKPGSTNAGIFNIASGVTNVVIENMTLDGSYYAAVSSWSSRSATSNRMGINCYINSSGSRIQNVTAYGFDKGIAVFGDQDGLNVFRKGDVMIDGCESYSNFFGFYPASSTADALHAVEYFKPSHMRLHDNTVNFYVGGGNIGVSGNEIMEGYIGVMVDGAVQNGAHSFISGNHINHNTGFGILLVNVSQGEQIYNNEILATASGASIVISNSTGVSVFGNNLGNSANIIIGASGIAAASIGPNFIYNNTYSGVWGTDFKVFDWNNFSNLVTDNTTNAQHWGNYSSTVQGDFDPYRWNPYNTSAQDGSFLTSLHAAQLTGAIPWSSLATNSASASDGWALTKTGNDGKLIALTGSGTVTSVDVAQQGFSSSGAVTGAGTITLTQNADKNHLGFSETNISNLAVTNTAVVGGTGIDPTNAFQVNARFRAKAFQVSTNGDVFMPGSIYSGPLGPFQVLNAASSLFAQNLTGIVPNASMPTNYFTIEQWDIRTNAANHSLNFSNTLYGGNMTLSTNGILSLNGAPMLDATAITANHHTGTGATTNLINQEDFTGYTNSVGYTNYGTGTNIVAVFDGNNHVGTITNGPDVWITPSVAGNSSGSWSWEINTNISLHLPYAVRWLAGSNGVSANVFSITNGEFDLSAYGGTNFPHLKAAIGENQ